MSLLPVILNELNAFRRPDDLFDQHFGMGLFTDDLLEPVISTERLLPLSTRYLRPWRAGPQRESGLSHITSDKDGFKVNLDVQQFKPEEINVKVVEGSVVVEGKHEERPDEHGYIQRQFTRRYLLPDNVNPDAITSTLSSDGVLSVCAPAKALAAPSNERTIPITHTQAPAITAQRKEKKKIEKGKKPEKGKKMEQ